MVVRYITRANNKKIKEMINEKFKKGKRNHTLPVESIFPVIFNVSGLSLNVKVESVGLSNIIFPLKFMKITKELKLFFCIRTLKKVIKNQSKIFR